MTKETEAIAKTDTSIATDKVTTVTTDTSTTSMKPVRSDDEKSLEDGIFPTSDNSAFPDIPDFTPPLRIHATRVPERLSGSLSALNDPNSNRQQQRRKSDPAAASRSRSTSPGGRHYDAGSSISSLEDGGIDSDILTDKMGFLELDLKEQQEMSQELNRSRSNLGPVSERLSEDTLEDCHAFSDIKPPESRGNSITTGGEVSSNVLEPLDECDDEEDEQGEEKVKITNMEEILESPEEEAEQAPK